MKSQLSLVLVTLLVSICAELPAQIPSDMTWQHLSTAIGDLELPTVGGVQQPDSWILDVDKDGLTDFVISERIVAPSMLWYRRHAGGWDRYVIDNTQVHLEAGGKPYDVDGDGDIDLIGGGNYLSNKIWWFENPYPNYDPNVPWTRHLMKTSGGPSHHDFLAGDFDNDGSDELVFWNQGGVFYPDNFLYITEFPANPKQVPDWPRTLIYDAPSAAEGLAKADVDLDGVDEIIGGGYWFDHAGGTTFTAHPLYPARPFTQVAAGQLIAGGRPEVVVSSGDVVGPLELYQWNGTTWTATALLPSDTFNAHSIEVIDFNADGHLDIFTGEMNLDGQNPDATTWILLGDGAGNFTTVEVSSGFGVHNAKVGDLDGDGDIDILGKPFNWDGPRVDVWLTNGTGIPVDSWQRHLIDELPWQPNILYARDINEDGRDDLIAGGWWWPNPGSISGTWNRNAFGPLLNNVAAVHDYDGDGHLDVVGHETKLEQPLTAADDGDRFQWGKGDGLGNFTIDYIGNAPGMTGADFLQGVTGGVYATGAPFQTVLSWQNSENSGAPVMTLRPPAGNLFTDPWVFGTLHPSSEGEGLTTADIDGDGDLDIFQGSQWLDNNGDGTFTLRIANQSILVYGTTDRNRLADVDGDGDLDAIIGFAHFEPAPTTSFVWLEQPDDPTQLWPAHVIATGVGGGYSLDVGDLDLDGDVDIVLGEHLTETRLLLYQNHNQGTVWQEHVIDAGGLDIDHHLGSRLHDLDDDGDLDVVSIGWTHDKLWIFENLGADQVLDVLAPSTPLGFVATALDERSIELSWEASPEADLASYNIYRSPTPGFLPSPANLLATVTETHHVDSGHPELTTFSYAVRAVDLSGNASDPTPHATATTSADETPPQILRACAISPTRVRLDFDEPLATGAMASLGHYEIPGLTVIAATPDSPTRVTLITTPMGVASTYSVGVTGLTDLSLAENVVVDAANFVSGAELEACYLLDDAEGETAVDATGNGHDGATTNTTWSDDSHPSGIRSLAFDGATSRVAMGPFDAGESAITFSLWFRADSLATADGRLLSKATGVQPEQHYWMLSTIIDQGVPRLRWRLKAGGTTATLIPHATAIPVGSWTHVAAVYDGLTMALYQDGIEVASLVHAGPIDMAPLVPVAIGNQPDGAGARPFHGLIDEVAIYGRALTAAEVATLAGIHPVTMPDSGDVDSGESLTISVTDNDGSAQTPIDVTTVEIVASPRFGTATAYADGTIVYAHAGGLSDPIDRLYYVASDVNGRRSSPTPVTFMIHNIYCPPPVVDIAPLGGDLCPGRSFTLLVSASVTEPATYQWRRSGIPIAGAETPTLTVQNAQASDSGDYDVLITDACGSVISASALITVLTPPTLIAGPTSLSHCSGETASFSANAVGHNLVYQWRHNGVVIPGEASATLELGPVTAADAGGYQVTVINACGSVTSGAALLIVDLAPTIVSDPQPLQQCEGSSALLTVSAIGQEPITYQWRRNAVAIPGAHGPTLLIPALAPADAGSYDVVVSNDCGSVTSAASDVIVDPLPTLHSVPTDQHLCAGDSVFLAVSVSGATSFQWSRNGVPIPGATLSSYSVGNLLPSDAGTYTIAVTGICGTVVSSSIEVTVTPLPDILASPLSQVTCEGFGVSLSVVTNSADLALQWRKDGVNIVGATSTSYTIPSVTTSDAGSYDVVAMNSCDMVSSDVAVLDVLPQSTCDCNANGLLDGDELAAGDVEDCNGNGVPDDCDVATGASIDSNLDGMPDECSTAFLRGDCNNDSSRDVSDPVTLLGFLFLADSPPSCLDACDGNDDGSVDLADVMELLCGMFCTPPSPLPAPFSTCGLDPTVDLLDCGATSCP